MAVTETKGKCDNYLAMLVKARAVAAGWRGLAYLTGLSLHPQSSQREREHQSHSEEGDGMEGRDRDVETKAKRLERDSPHSNVSYFGVLHGPKRC